MTICRLQFTPPFQWPSADPSLLPYPNDHLQTPVYSPIPMTICRLQFTPSSQWPSAGTPVYSPSQWPSAGTPVYSPIPMTICRLQFTPPSQWPSAGTPVYFPIPMTICRLQFTPPSQWPSAGTPVYSPIPMTICRASSLLPIPMTICRDSSLLPHPCLISLLWRRRLSFTILSLLTNMYIFSWWCTKRPVTSWWNVDLAGELEVVRVYFYSVCTSIGLPILQVYKDSIL